MGKYTKVKDMQRTFGLELDTMMKLKHHNVLPPAEMVEGVLQFRTAHVHFMINRIVSDACEAMSAAQAAIKARQELDRIIDEAPEVGGDEVAQMAEGQIVE